MDLIDGGLPELPIKIILSEIVGFIRRSSFKVRSDCVFGLSGGIDSAVVAYLLVKALGKERVRPVIMPYHQSTRQSLEDALEIVDILGLSYSIIDISPSIDAYFSRFPEADNYRKGNKMARERMAVLYDMAARYNALVVGTGNRSELLLGYFTKYGDGGVDIAPLGGLFKTYIYLLGKYLGVPQKIIDKPPTADLWPGQKDEDDLGIEYAIADQILYQMVDRGSENESIIGLGFKREHVLRVQQMVKSSEHKRALPPVPDIIRFWVRGNNL